MLLQYEAGWGRETWEWSEIGAVNATSHVSTVGLLSLVHARASRIITVTSRA